MTLIAIVCVDSLSLTPPLSPLLLSHTHSTCSLSPSQLSLSSFLVSFISFHFFLPLPLSHCNAHSQTPSHYMLQHAKATTCVWLICCWQTILFWGSRTTSMEKLLWSGHAATTRMTLQLLWRSGPRVTRLALCKTWALQTSSHCWYH